MTTAEFTQVALLIAAQLLVLRASQYLVPTLYFTTASLFDERSDVRVRSIAFRLLIPFATGVVAALLTDEHSIRNAIIATTAAWLLATWPAIWSPSMLPHPYLVPIFLLIAVFTLSWAALGWLGASVVELTERLHDNQELDATNVVFGAGASLLTSVLVGATSRVAQKKVTFVDDDEVFEDGDHDLEWPLDDPGSQRLTSNALLGVLLGVAVLAVARLLRRSR